MKTRCLLPALLLMALLCSIALVLSCSTESQDDDDSDDDDDSSEDDDDDDDYAPCDGCLIDDVCYPDGVTDPTNVCAICDVSESPDSWTDNDGVACNDEEYCNGADECLAGACDVHAGDPCPDNGLFCDGEEFCDETNDVCDTENVPCEDEGQVCNEEQNSCDYEVLVPAGTFYMGCEPNDTRCSSDESPRHEVQLSSYYIDTYEVTNAQYADYLNNINPSNLCYGHQCAYSMHPDYLGLYESGGTWQVDATYEDRPVVYVSWYGAKGYCESRGERLPTEAEWEKAAKGASQHYIYPWGDAWIVNAANCWGNNDPFESGTYPETTPVGYFDGSNHGGAYQTTDGRSPYGAHDMAGNVWELVNDWYQSDYYSQTPPGGWIDPQGPTSGTYRVMRGGSWGSLLVSLRASIRLDGPTDWIDYFGFRCARDAE